MKVLLFLLITLPMAVRADDRSSSDYSVQSDTVNGGGGPAVSATYSHDGALGGLPVAQTSATVENKNGHLARIFDITARALELDPAEVDEQESVKAEMRDILDDGTRLGLDPTDFTWTNVEGPITLFTSGANAGRIAGQIVYEDTPAAIKTTRGGDSWTLNLTVRNVNPDNFGSYAGDGLDDAWQEQYFGLDNPDAAPDQDPDEDGQDNAFEERAGLDPTSDASVFRFWIERDPAHQGGMQVKFEPRFTGRTYQVRMTDRLDGVPEPVWGILPAGTTTEDNGTERTLQIPPGTAEDGPRFFRVLID